MVEFETLCNDDAYMDDEMVSSQVQRNIPWTCE
jgi:hypothetical protein